MKTWKWEEFTSPNFAKAVAEVSGVCIVPLGVLERHGDHLPLGTDVFAVQALAEEAAAKEPAVVFPQYYFGQIQEAKNWPGTIAIDRDLQLRLLENVCTEIARNGCHKIILLNGHGGNTHFLQYFVMSMLEKPHDFVLYLVRIDDYAGPVRTSEEWKAMVQNPFDWHGGEAETSVILHQRPELVKMEDLSAPGVAQGRLNHLPKLMTTVWWNADFPNHYAGDASHASAEKGHFLCEHYAENVASIIKAVKEDTETAKLLAEFFSASRH